MAVSANQDLVTTAGNTVMLRNLRNILPAFYCDNTARNLQDDLTRLQRLYDAQSRKLATLRQIIALIAELDHRKRSVAIKMDQLATVCQELDQLPDVSRELMSARDDLRASKACIRTFHQRYSHRVRYLTSAVADCRPELPTIRQFIIVSDTYTEYTIIQALSRLNSLIHLTSTFMARFMVKNFRYPASGEHSSAARRVSKFIAQPLVDCLGKLSRDGVALYLPIAFQTYLVSRLSYAISSLSKVKEHDRLLNGMHERVQDSESRVFATRWRSLTYAHGPAHDTDNLVTDIIRGLSNIALVAGCATSAPAAPPTIMPGFERKISHIVSTADTLAKSIWNARAADFKPVIGHPGQTFDGSWMELDRPHHSWAKSGGVGQKVLCTTYLGLVKEVVSESSGPAHKRTMTVSMVVKGKVLLESLLPNRWG